MPLISSCVALAQSGADAQSPQEQHEGNRKRFLLGLIAASEAMYEKSPLGDFSEKR